MTATVRIIFQPYTAGARGKLVAGTAIACRDEAEGLRRAEKAMAGGRVVGVHVVRLVADEEAGDFGEPHYLATIGVVPDAA